MAVFLWEATSRKGDLKKGEVDTANENALRGKLRRQGFKSITIRKKPKKLSEYFPFRQEKVKEKEVVVFSRVFSTMINAGVPLIQCLDLLAQQEQNKAFRKIITTVKEDIAGGSNLCDAMKKYPKVFNDVFVNLIAAGESGGVLDVILNRLSAYMEKTAKLKSKVKGAMTYPASVLVVAVGVVSLLLLKVIPVFQKMFEGMGGQLPRPTQLLVDTSQFMLNYYIHIFVGFIIIGIAFNIYYKTEKGRWNVDALMLKLPVFGPLLIRIAVSRFSRTLSTMMGSGVPILEGFKIVSKTVGNKVIEKAIQQTRQSVSEGKTIAEPLAGTNIFPPMVVQMIAVGEATGALDAMLVKIADFYDDEVDVAVDAITALLEPAMMILLGCIVGGMIIAMYLPILNMVTMVGG